MRLSLATLLVAVACSSPDDDSGDLHLVLVQAPDVVTPGSPTSQPLLVKVVNGDGVGIAGVPVRWSVSPGNGALGPSADTSGVDGLASARWVPGLQAGTQQVGAYIYDQPALSITVKADAFHADKLSTMLGRGCGLRGAEVWCWKDDYQPRPIRRILPQVEAHDMAASYGLACVLDAAGSTYCNQAFDDTDPQAFSTIPGLPLLNSIAGGGRNFCGIAVADNTPWCWRDFAAVPAQASSLALSHLSVGNDYACGLDAAGAAWCWNPRFGGAALVAGGLAFQSVSANGYGASACGITGAEVWCWLSNQAPARVVGFNAGQIALGFPFALLNTGPIAVTAMAQEDYGTTPTLDLTAFDSRTFPLPVRQVYPACVLAHDGAAYCLIAPDINLPVIPTPTYWQAVAAPPS